MAKSRPPHAEPTVTFWGAAQTVTGSMHRLDARGKSILLDCGLFQGSRAESLRRNREFPFRPREIDAVVLSHAHIDHCGNLPTLLAQGFAGPIYCTPATRALAAVLLGDSAKIQREDAEYLNRKRAKGEPKVEPLYDGPFVYRTLLKLKAVPYGEPFEVVRGVEATFSDAGHLLGSAMVSLHIATPTGLEDSVDQCPDQPEIYNAFEDTDGCPDDPDTDGDRVTDSKDQCLLDPEDTDGYLDDDGCPEPDNDADGIADAADKCPNQAEDFDGFQDDDGCPDPDNDSDTVLDVDDQCPNTAGAPGGERPGCPKKNSLVIVTGKEIRITQQIQFDFDKARIKPVSYPILNEVRDVLRDNPKITLEIQGHTDNVGNGAYNLKLSQARADSVRAYLVSNGVGADRMTAKGYGMTQPLVKNDTAANRTLNRRVQFIRTENGPP